VMNINMTLSQQAELAMPISGNGPVAAVRVLPMGASPAAADRTRFSIDTTPVCGYSLTTDVAVLKGTFPGTSAWSPPI
jgi:hypothetical protein